MPQLQGEELEGCCGEEHDLSLCTLLPKISVCNSWYGCKHVIILIENYCSFSSISYSNLVKNYYFGGLGIKPKAFCMLSMSSSTESHPQTQIIFLSTNDQS
jgi:hypothetical protein